jgi:mRNA-degrading endonuclease RelE of RelBE toxin-antitoxin system
VKKRATIVCSRRFDTRFFAFPAAVREAIEHALHDLASRLDRFPHQKLKGVDAYKLRVGDYRVIYEFNAAAGRIDALAVGNRRDIYEREL